MSKRVKQQQQQEAEAALTRNETTARGPSMGIKEDVVLVGNLIGEDHVNYVLMYNMLTGIRIGVRSAFICRFHMLTETAVLAVSG